MALWGCINVIRRDTKTFHISSHSDHPQLWLHLYRQHCQLPSDIMFNNCFQDVKISHLSVSSSLHGLCWFDGLWLRGRGWVLSRRGTRNIILEFPEYESALISVIHFISYMIILKFKLEVCKRRRKNNTAQFDKVCTSQRVIVAFLSVDWASRYLAQREIVWIELPSLWPVYRLSHALINNSVVITSVISSQTLFI